MSECNCGCGGTSCTGFSIRVREKSNNPCLGPQGPQGPPGHGVSDLKPIITGETGGNVALKNLLSALDQLGLIVNETTD